MDDQQRLRALRREGLAFAATLDGDHATPVSACPGWDLGRLAQHLGEVHRNVTGSVLTPPDQRYRWRPVDRDVVGPALAPWFAEGLDRLVDALEASQADELAPTFFGPQPRRFWHRRQAVETAVHRWDAQSALGAPDPIAADLATDGIDELLDVLAPMVPRERFDLDDRTAHLHALDGTGEWFVTFDAEAPARVERVHARGDVAVRGTASQLLLALWGREPDGVEVLGDADVFTRWRAAVAF